MKGHAIRCDKCGAVEFEDMHGEIPVGNWIGTLRTRFGEQHFCSPECAIEALGGNDGN